MFFCLKLAGIFTPTFTRAIINPNTIQAYDLLFPSKTPYVDNYCVPLSNNREGLTKYHLKNYMCSCIEIDAESKLFFENLYENIVKMKEQGNPQLKAFSNTFAVILWDLQREFIKQYDVIKYIKDKNSPKPSTYGSPISTFIINNTHLPIDQFYVQYYVFLLYHILGKYNDHFEKLEDFEIRTLLTNEFDIINCYGRHAYAHGEFKNLVDVIKTVNRKVVGLANSFSKMYSLKFNKIY